MTGTTIAQAIPIAISPILTRLYTPEDFGVLTLFVAITSIFGSIANARYELAIMLPKKDEDAINILALGFIINLFLSLFLLMIILIFHDYILNLLNNKEISPWLYLVPISVFLMGCFNLLNYYNNRKKYYKDLAKANVFKSIGSAIVQLILGFLKVGAIGLISGQIFAQIISNTKLFLNIKKDNLFIKIKKIKIIALAKRYKDFPKFSMWAILANTLSVQLTNILISTFYSISTLGFYSLAQRVLAMPMSLIGGSIGQVFFQEATKEKQDTGKAIKTFNSTVKKLFIIGFPIFFILFFIIEDLFAFVFGEEWRVAGEYAKILIPLFFIRFIVSVLTLIPIIFEAVKIDLYFQLGLIILYLMLFIVNKFLNSNFIELLYSFNYVIGGYYLIYFFILNKMKKGKQKD
jgi:O-antigen/teichoic acid export membrane protein